MNSEMYCATGKVCRMLLHSLSQETEWKLSPSFFILISHFLVHDFGPSYSSSRLEGNVTSIII